MIEIFVISLEKLAICHLILPFP